MKGIRVVGGGRAEVATLPVPEAKTGWVVVRSTRSAVCGSDLHNYRQSPEKLGDRANRIAGHEAVGTVEAIGDGVEGLSVGDRVVVYQHYGCGRCTYCQNGEPMFCPERRTLGNHVDGADAEFVNVPAGICLSLPDDLSDDVGALVACNFGTAFSGVRKLGLSATDTVVVFGLGPVGLCAVIVAASDGADVFAVDPVRSRRELAENLGAKLTVDPTDEDTRAAVLEATGGLGAEASVDCSGNPAAQTESLGVLRANGKMLVLAATAEWTFDPSQLWRRGLTVFGSWVYALGEYEAAIRLAQRHADALESIITHRLPGSEGEEAFRVADSGEAGKVVLDWTKG